jgi:CBS domain containing-hemolysin-like protein
MGLSAPPSPILRPQDDRLSEGSPIDAVLGIAAVLALIFAHGFFVAGEFGLVAADRNKVERLAEKGHRGATSTLTALRSLSFQLSGAQLGITLTSLIVGFIAEPTIGELLAPVIEDLGLPEQTSLGVAVVIALILATAVEMVVGELIPKNVAIAKPQETAFKVSTPLRVYNKIFRPLILFLNAAANWTVRLFGIEPREELRSVRSLEELDLLIRSSHAEGALREDEASLLARSISFENKVAADALIPRTSVVGLPEDAAIGDMTQKALDTGHSRFPVYSETLDDIKGTAHIKDAYRFEPKERAGTPITAIVEDAIVVPESRDLASLLVEMRRERKHLVIVIDEFGGTAGILTIEDLLEEIVGEIEDEYDPDASAGVSQTPEGVHVISGMLHPDEVEEATGFEMPEGDYETIGGFLFSLLGEIPEVGAHASFNGWELKVVGMDGKRIDRVLIVAPPSPSEEDEA